MLSTAGRTLTLAPPIDPALDVTAAPAVAPAVATLEFGLKVTRGGVTIETFPILSTTPGHPRYWATVTPQNIRLAEPAAPAGVEDPRPVAASYSLNPGTNDNVDDAWGQIVSDPGTLEPLKRLDDMSIVCVPGLTNAAAQQAVIQHCEDERNRFAILDPPARLGVQQILAHRQQLRTTGGYGALYYPNILIRNPQAARTNCSRPPGTWPASTRVRTRSTASTRHRRTRSSPARSRSNGR